MPVGGSDWINIKTEYKHDDNGNWIKCRIIDTGQESCNNKYLRRKVYYLDE